MKLNIGAGDDIKEGWINLDIAPLKNIDVVHDLNQYPWPFKDEQFDEVLAKDVVEHLDNFLKAMAEIHRITKRGGILDVQVPYWNSWSRHTDPTHRNSFTEDTFRFFDPNEALCKERPYYTTARFDIIDEAFVITPILPLLPLPGFNYAECRSKWSKWILRLVAGFLSNIIQDLKYKLRRV